MELRFVVERVEPGWTKISAVENGVSVSWLYVVDLELHYGSSTVKAGGVAGVYTPREHRGRGYSASTLRYAINWMREQGYPFTALFGIMEYYHRFGYRTFMGEHTLTIHLRSLSRVEAEELEWELSEDPGFAAGEIAGIYESTNAAWPCARVRGESWRGFRKGVSWEHPAKPLVLKSSGRVVAYAALERWPAPEELLVAEVGAVNHDISLYKSLLKVLYGMALAERKSHVTFHVPPNHPFARLARGYGCRTESFYPWSGGGMARVLHLTLLLQQIERELERRSRGVEGDVTLRVENEEVTIRCRDGSVKVEEGCRSSNILELGPGEAAQLITGYRGLEEVMPHASIKGFARACAKLFPGCEPYVWQPDRW